MDDQIRKLPQEFIHRIEELYSSNASNILRTFTKKKLTSFRINNLKTDLHTLRAELNAFRIPFRELSYPRGAFIMKTQLRTIQKTPIYTKGLIYIQNVSSMIPPLILNPQEAERILDLCAAPGAKATQIISLCPNVELTAIEKIRVRYYKLLANLKIQGVDKKQVRVLLLDGVFVRKKFPEYFDKILLDVPCSAEGRFWTGNPRTYKYWRMRKIKEMESKQKKLISAAFYALKEKGEMVYSTCTFSPEENEGVIDWFLNKFKEKVEVLPLDIPIINIKDGIRKWKNKRFSHDLKLTKRIIPNEYMEGFYIARLRKTSY